MIRAIVTLDAFSPETEVARFSAERSGSCGALVTFTGYCRARSDRRHVEHLDLDHYPGFTDAEVERLTRAVAEKHAVHDVLVIHRAGMIAAGEAIVLVAVSSAHRASAFAAAEELMDRLKTDAPFWKRECGPAGAHWVDPTDEDYVRREEHGE
ncbi:MAG: molybdenum cofactor biosynthesis protein MoaE [Hyphomonadaceae bacterium]